MSAQSVTTSSCDRNQPCHFAQQCIKRDIDRIKTDDTNSVIIFVEPIENNFLHLEAAISGPMSTAYENGIFLLDLKFSDQYPYFPPLSITFKRATMHANVDEYGKFMSELLKPESWSPAMTIKDILEHIWARLAVPDVESNECDPTRAHSYRTDKERFEIIAREYSIKYANAT